MLVLSKKDYVDLILKDSCSMCWIFVALYLLLFSAIKICLLYTIFMYTLLRHLLRYNVLK